jgi:hypothetical protein
MAQARVLFASELRAKLYSLFVKIVAHGRDSSLAVAAGRY